MPCRINILLVLSDNYNWVDNNFHGSSYDGMGTQEINQNKHFSIDVEKFVLIINK